METIAKIRQRIEERRDLHESAEMEAVLAEGIVACLQELAKKVAFEVAAVYAYSERQKNLCKIADYGGGVNFIERIRFDHGYGLSAWVAQKQKPVYLPDIHRGSRHGYSPIRSYLSLPILIEDELAGVINFAHVKPHAFERKAMILIKNFAEALKPIFRLYQKSQVAYIHDEESFARRR